VLSSVIFLGACANDEPLKDSILDVSTPSKTALDSWIDTNYLIPYNINVQYKWNQNLVDNNRFLAPPLQSKVQPALEIVQKIWLDSYKAIAGADFVKTIAQRICSCWWYKFKYYRNHNIRISRRWSELHYLKLIM
jgi:substrate import-associated zinc metallohydrolase lipoprotein